MYVVQFIFSIRANFLQLLSLHLLRKRKHNLLQKAPPSLRRKTRQSPKINKPTRLLLHLPNPLKATRRLRNPMFPKPKKRRHPRRRRSLKRAKKTNLLLSSLLLVVGVRLGYEGLVCFYISKPIE